MEMIAAIDDVMPTIWYKLRIRLDDDIYNPAQDARRYKFYECALAEFFDIIQKYSLDKITSGLEVHNKRGAYTYPHIHIHFTSQVKKDTILKAIKRHYEAEFGDPLKGNKMYSFTPELNVRSDAFFRYPLKQIANDPEVFKCCAGFKHETLCQLRAIAYAQEMIRWQINDKKETQKEEHSSIYERAENKLKDTNAQTPLDVALGIQDLYLKENRPVNNVTIAGYTLTYCLQNGIISKEKNAKNILSHINI